MVSQTPDSPFLRRIRIRNYKSIAACDLPLRPLTLLIGRNGAGKSNFLDAIQFVADALRTSLPDAIVGRGGASIIRRRSAGHPTTFAIELELALEDRTARYGFEIAAAESGYFRVRIEQLRVFGPDGKLEAYFQRKDSRPLISHAATLPPVAEDRLYLANAAGLPEFRPVYDALLATGFYNLSPDSIKEVQQADSSVLLRSDGRNLPSVVARLIQTSPEVMDRIQDYLHVIVPVVRRVDPLDLGPRQTLVFHQQVDSAVMPWPFYASSMSDGTLRALGILVAAHQLTYERRRVRLVGIEEPEVALHPAAVGALLEALREASGQTQILLTSHSPDLLDEIDLEHDGLLVVVAPEGTTRIAAADAASMEALRRHLYSAGELLRMDQLQPDAESLQRQEHLELLTEDLEVA